MGILNVTPDSFYSASRMETERAIEARLIQIVAEGADIIDIGACSTRPNSEIVEKEIEWKRLEQVFEIVRRLDIKLPLSVDTFRAEIAERCVCEGGVSIINDISGGAIDPRMWEMVAALQVPYVLTHSEAEGENCHKHREYYDVTAEILTDLSKKINKLRSMNVNDIIVDPGFGFSKNIKENFKLLEDLKEFNIFTTPILVGLSRKSMIYKTLGKSPEDSLVGSISLEAFALDRGADILRVHDVGATKELVDLYCVMKNNSEAI